MKRTGKPVFFIVAIITIVFTILSITGISSYYGDIQSVYIKGGDQIRWGIDIRGGVEVTFVPAQDGADPTNEELDGAAEVMRQPAGGPGHQRLFGVQRLQQRPHRGPVPLGGGRRNLRPGNRHFRTGRHRTASVY